VGDYFPLAASAEGESALFELMSGNMHRIVSAPLNASNKLHSILSVTSAVAILDTGSDGSLYLDQWDRPLETIRVSAEGGTPEHLSAMMSSTRASLNCCHCRTAG